MQALGFSQPQDLLQCKQKRCLASSCHMNHSCSRFVRVDCVELQWKVSSEDQLVHPRPSAHARLGPTGIEQLETLSQYVLHLEQSTVLKLP